MKFFGKDFFSKCDYWRNPQWKTSFFVECYSSGTITDKVSSHSATATNFVNQVAELIVTRSLSILCIESLKESKDTNCHFLLILVSWWKFPSCSWWILKSISSLFWQVRFSCPFLDFKRVDSKWKCSLLHKKRFQIIVEISCSDHNLP